VAGDRAELRTALPPRGGRGGSASGEFWGISSPVVPRHSRVRGNPSPMASIRAL